MAQPASYTCTISKEEVPERLAQLHRLVGGLQSRERHGREVRLRFDPALAPVLDAFVRDEARCCAFYEFAISRSEETLELTVRAPAGAEALLASLFDVFDPGGAGRAEPSP